MKMNWRDLLNESKDRLIDRLDLSDQQKGEMKAFFKKRPNLENRLDWNKPKSITWDSFEKIRDEMNEPIDPDTVPEFSDKRNEGNGIVSYEVEDNDRGMLAVRKVVDTHWGKKVNPWCLISREDYGEDADITQVGSAATFWDRYSAFPKRIAFKNGKLLAFFASAGYDEDQDYDPEGYGIAPWLPITAEEVGKLKDEYKEWLDTEEGQEEMATFAQWIEVNYPELYERATTAEETWWDRMDQPHTDVKEIKENYEMTESTKKDYEIKDYPRLAASNAKAIMDICNEVAREGYDDFLVSAIPMFLEEIKTLMDDYKKEMEKK